MSSNGHACRLLVQVFVALFLTGVMVSMPILSAFGEVSGSTFYGWQVGNFGGQCSESNSTFRIWTDGGSNPPLMSLYKQVSPVADFSFSCEVKAAKMESCAIAVRSKLPMGNDQGFNFEFGHYGAGMFILSRHTGEDNWTWNTFANGDANTWYTMQLSVFKEPFRVVAEVFDENGALLGSASASDMSNISFEEIKYMGLIVWGYSPSDYFFRNIKSTLDDPSYISISTESFSTLAGSAVNVVGTLCDSNSTPLQDKLVVLSYTFPGAESWIPISSGLTNEVGEYNIQWINSASGTFTLKAEWRGDASLMGASNTTTLGFLPYSRQQVLFVESNSTISSLSFNSTSSEISFNATGPSGTSGYVIVTVAKTAVPNGTDIKVYLDGKQLNYTVTSTDDSWLIAFKYLHSTHQISMYLGTNLSSNMPFEVDYRVLLAVVITLAVVTVLIIGAIWKMGKNGQVASK